MKYMRFVVFVSCFLIPQKVFSWGNEGHSIVALSAQAILKEDPSEEAKKTLAATGAILGSTPIDKAAIWPDEVKNESRACDQAPYLKDPHYKNPNSSAICDAYKYTSGWHFVNTDAKKYVYDPDKRDYFKGDMVVIIRLLSHLLKGEDDPTLKPIGSFKAWRTQCLKKTDHPCKKEALEFLIHLVGDIHQPLHSGAACDLGGNAQYIVFFGAMKDPAASWCGPQDPPECSNHELHQSWDANLLVRGPKDGAIQYVSNDDYSRQLVKIMGENNLTSSSDAARCVTVPPQKAVDIDGPVFPAAWADESLCYMPQIYSFPDDPSAKEDAKVNRCQKERRIKTSRGMAYKAYQVGRKYYDASIATINERLYWGGYRLANLLKAIYGDGDKWAVGPTRP